MAANMSDIQPFSIYNVNCNHKNTAIKTGMGTASRGTHYDVLACQEISEPCAIDGYDLVAFGRDHSHTLNTALFFSQSNSGWQKKGGEKSISISAQTQRAATAHIFSSRQDAKTTVLVMTMHLKSGERFEKSAGLELIALAKYSMELARVHDCKAIALVGDLNWADPEICAELAEGSPYKCSLLYGEDQMSGRSLMGGVFFYQAASVSEVSHNGCLALTHEGHAITESIIHFK